MIRRRKNVALPLLLSLCVALLFFSSACQSNTSRDILREAASSYRFSLVRWHVRNLPPKLVSRSFSLGTIPPLEGRKALVDEFFALQSEIKRLEGELVRAITLQGDSPEAKALEEGLREMRLEYMSRAPQVEAIIEYGITHALASQGFGFSVAGCHCIFPPVLFVFQPAPHILVVSPRDRIEWLGYEILYPSLNMSEFELVEEKVAQGGNLSAIVMSPGGLSSYPTIIDEGAGFYRTLYVVTHEWVHQYLIFYPLGRAWFQQGVARQMNETVADIIGYEVADQIYRRYGYEPPPRELPPTETGFDFAAEMRQTRLVTGQLLEEGKIDEAEQYMEERRQLFVQEGYYIRKLNQAYFAARDAYPLSLPSISPVGQQLEELRGYYDSLNEFVLAVRGLRTHEQLLTLLDEKHASNSTLTHSSS